MKRTAVTFPENCASVSRCLIAFLLFTCGNILQAEEALRYSPVASNSNPTGVFWGDTHLHSNNSPDSYTFGNTALTAEEAYRFARGERIKSQFGIPVQLRQPLDFLVVADHAEFLGIFPLLEIKDPDFLETKLGKYWNQQVEAGNRGVVLKDFVRALRGEPWDYKVEKQTYVSVWNNVAALADSYNEPGRFTTFTGYEWTSMPGGNNLHRVVMFKDGADKVTQVIPFSAIESDDPEDLWAFLEDYENSTGGEVLAIPHNSNVSNGLMFSPARLDGSKLNREYARARTRWEPVLEVTQTKGDSETHPLLSPNDEFADFETWDLKNIDGSVNKQPWMLQYEYARSALQEGLRHEKRLGINPFQFGMIGSTDSHTSLATADEDNFFGKFPIERPTPERATAENAPFYENWRLASSGYAAVWARENTRDSIFAAIKRREVYATTGPRIVLRLFAGWDFLPSDIYSPNFADIGYQQGVPMGGVLKGDNTSKAPRIIVMAARDPHGAKLDRIQVIKGWIDDDGNSRERIYNVALSGDRQAGPGKQEAEPVRNTVIVSEATYSNSVGATELSAWWQDPDFDPAQAAFYYVRVVEIPTPRWTAYDALRFKLDLPPHIPMQQQERAYSSPIWYAP